MYSTNYEYDVQGRIKELTYPDGEIVTYSYDEGGFLNRLEGNQVYIDEIKYDKYGQRSYLKYGNGTEMTYDYNPATRLLDVFTTKDNSGDEILRYDYNFNITGNITSIIDNAGDIDKSIQNYNYDLMGRLTHADGDYLSGTNTYNRDYVYDDDNRIIQKTYENGMQYDFSYVANTHAISSVDITNGGEGQKNINFDYDDYGNMIKKEIYAGAVQLESTDYIYDENNRLKTLDDGIIELNFKYDNKGQRIKKVFEDEAAVVKETTYVNGFYTISDGRIDKHISDGNYIIASKIDDDSVNIKFYHQNHIGSTAALTDKDGEKFQAYLFYPYGEMWVEEESVADDDITRFFTSQEFDQESGLYYFNARYYDPHIGMFMRPDPAMAQLNHYAYAGCNPIMYNDPTGLDFGISLAIGIICSVIAAAIGISVAAVNHYTGAANRGGADMNVKGGGSIQVGSNSGGGSSGGDSSQDPGGGNGSSSEGGGTPDNSSNQNPTASDVENEVIPPLK